MTTPKHHKKVTDLFLAACELKPEERAAYLDEACKDDSELRAEVEALLAQDHEHASFLEVAPTLVDEDGSGTTNMDGPAAPAGGLPPDRIPGYEILRKIHGGGQGVVYQAVQIATQRKVAIKILHEGPFASEASRGRFQREIASVAGLDHPNIVKVLDSGVAEGNYFYAMDYIRGKPLDEFVRDANGAADKILAAFAKICDAVHYAHRKGVIHRDLKPSNILVDHRGEPHVVDFGMAKVAGGSSVGQDRPMLISITGQVVGTLPYMSPEQARGDPEQVDARTDIYSLGVVLYLLLTGQFPYEVVGNMRDILDNILRAEPKPPSTIRRKIDSDIETIILKSLSKEPERRYQSVAELGRDVAHFLAGEPIDAKRDSGWYVFKKRMGRHRRALATVSIIAVVIAVFGGIAYVSTVQREQAEGRTQDANALVEEERRQKEYYMDKSSRDEYLAGLLGPAAAPVQPPPENWGLINREATVHLNCPGKPGVLNPLVMETLADLFVCELLFERLFVRTAELELIQNEHIVANIEESDDPLERIVHIRKDLRWHDGMPLTAEDIVFSWQQTISDLVESSKHDKAVRLAEVVAEDATTLRFVFREIDATWRFSMNFELIPRHLFVEGLEEDPTLKTSEFFKKRNLEPVGCGPFKFASWGDDDDTIILERCEEYEGNKPHIKRLVIHWITKANERLPAFLEGRLDFFELTPQQYRNNSFEDDFTSKGEAAGHPSTTFFYIAWNCDAESNFFFADARVRRAMTHATNIEQVKAQVTDNLAVPCYGPFAINTPYFDTAIRRLSYNLNRAAELLDEAGWRLGEDGLRRRNLSPGRLVKKTVPFRFRISVYKGAEEWLRTAEILRQNLAKIGVDAIIDKNDYDEYLRRLKTGEFDAIIGGRTPAMDPDFWGRFFYTDGLDNSGHYSNPEVDALFDEGISLLDPDERAACYQKIHRLIYEDQPMTFLYHTPSLWAINQRLEGVAFSVRGPYLFYPGIRQWWVPKE